MYKPTGSDFGCILDEDFEGLKGNPEALRFERERLEEGLRIAKEHLSKLRGLRVKGSWLANRIAFQEREVRKHADLLNYLLGLIGTAPRHLAR